MDDERLALRAVCFLGSGCGTRAIDLGHIQRRVLFHLQPLNQPLPDLQRRRLALPGNQLAVHYMARPRAVSQLNRAPAPLQRGLRETSYYSLSVEQPKARVASRREATVLSSCADAELTFTVNMKFRSSSESIAMPAPKTQVERHRELIGRSAQHWP